MVSCASYTGGEIKLLSTKVKLCLLFIILINLMYKKDILLYLMAQKPLQDPFCAEVNFGAKPMAQWLYGKLLKKALLQISLFLCPPVLFGNNMQRTSPTSQQSEFNKDYLRGV